jgi:glycerol-3-phosphate dehydrogenase
MRRNPAALTERTFDLAIIGGGILGAGIARDATLRGLSVALVERNDLASGTSSRSTKLVHGGLRYLEHFAFGLVAEACRERSTLLDMAPHLVKPLSILLPVYDGDPRSLGKIRLGTTVYDWLTPNRHALTPRHRTLTPDEAVAEEPALPQAGLRGAVLFYDCQMDDARLCLETILDANRNGAVCANYCAVTGFRRAWDQIEAAQVVDERSGAQFDLRARLYVNAAGPWVERVAKLSRMDEPTIALSPTKGVHLVIPKILRKHGVYFQSKQDRRMIFLLPWDDASLLGTTDTDYPDDPASVCAELADVDYLLGQLHVLMPEAAVSRNDVITSFAGVRALLRADGRPSGRSREERMVLQGDNLLNVAGGKYTTFRAIADKAVRKAFRLLGRRAPRCPTANVPLQKLRPSMSGEQFAESPQIFESDVAYACNEEMAVTLADVMRRRTRLALSSDGGIQTAERVSRVMAEQLGWDEATREKNLQCYADEWDRSRLQVALPSGT